MKTIFLTLILISSVGMAKEVSTEKETLKVVSLIEKLTKKKKPVFKDYASSIVKYSQMYQVDAKIIVSVIMTESSFNINAVSTTGDLGLGQINPNKWVQEFKRIYKEDLDLKRLVSDYDYSIQKMVQILKYHKCKKDPHWIGKYHSKTSDLKLAYFGRVNEKMNRLRSLASAQ